MSPPGAPPTSPSTVTIVKYPAPSWPRAFLRSTSAPSKRGREVSSGVASTSACTAFRALARRRRRPGLGPGVSVVSGLGRGVGPGLGIPCRRGRRRGRCGPRRGRRFQVQVPARPRISAEITVCRWGSLQPFSRDVHSYTTPWATYGATASSATAASMPPGSGPRHRRRSSK